MPEFGFDPERLLEAAKRAVADAPAQLADGFSRLVRESPERVEQVMRSPARRPILDAIFWQMPKRIDSERAQGVSASVRWYIGGRPDGGADTYQLEIDNGRCHTVRDPEGPDPALAITVEDVEFLRLASGNSDPMQAYFKGRIQLSGDVMLAAQVGSLFRMPGAGGPDAPPKSDG